MGGATETERPRRSDRDGATETRGQRRGDRGGGTEGERQRRGERRSGREGNTLSTGRRGGGETKRGAALSAVRPPRFARLELPGAASSPCPQFLRCSVL